MSTFRITRFSHKKDNAPRDVELSLPELTTLLTQHQERKGKDGPCWSPAFFREGCPRQDQYAEEVSCLALDFDDGSQPEDYEALWNGYEFLVYSSFHNQIEKEAEPPRCRFRVVFPLLKPVPAERWPAFWLAASKSLGRGRCDGQCKNVGRVYYLPAHPPHARAYAFARHVQGRLLDPTELPASKPVTQVRLALEPPAGAFRPGTRNPSLFKVACGLLENGVPAEALAQALLAMNQTLCQPPLERDEVLQVAKSASSRAQRDSRLLASPYMSSEKASFCLTPLDELLDEPQEELEWVVEDLLPAGGFSMIAAKPKVGKSTLARSLIASVASGGSFLGRQVLSCGPALYFALEEKRSEVARQFRLLVDAGSDQSLIKIHTGPASENALLDLAALLEEHRPVLAVIDPLFLFIWVKDGCDYSEMTRKLEPLRALARRTGTHIALVHHNGKAQRDDGDGVLGSTAIFGGVDTLIDLRKAHMGRVAKSFQRYGRDLDDTLIQLDPETGRVQAGDSLEEAKRLDAEAKVLAALASGPAPEDEIKAAASCDNKAVGAAIRSLFGSGKIFRSGSGKRGDKYIYSLNPLPAELDVSPTTGVEVF